MRRSSSYAYRKPTKDQKNDWKPRKAKEPDVGTYEVSKSVSLVKPEYPQVSFPKGRNKKFTVLAAESKKHVPGAGHYKFDKMHLIARPYVKTRY